MKLEGEPLSSVNSFKYLGSVIDGGGGCGKDVDGRIKAEKQDVQNSGQTCDGVSEFGHCANKKNTVYTPQK